MSQIQARNIVRLAKKYKLTLERGSTNRRPNRGACARSVLAKHVDPNLIYSVYDDAIARKLGVEMDDLNALESGFEGWPLPNTTPLQRRYYNVGKHVAELAGLKGSFTT